LPHLLFLEKMASFPIVNANLYIKKYYKRLMRSHLILNKAGFDILFTGIITEKIIDALSMDPLIGSFVGIEEASREVGKICDAYKHDDIDLTILLTHIGLDSDIALAKLLKPEWGVDIIIGGHSHSYMKKPLKINNVLIAQAGTGTNQVGRFDIVVDDDTNSIVDYTWKAIEITDQIAKPDRDLLAYINSYKKVVDKKYNTIITKFSTKLTHPKREIETALGNLMADIFAQNAECDIMFVGSGSIRVKELGPMVTLGDIMAKRLESLVYKGKPVEDHTLYTICLQGFHVNNAGAYLGVPQEEMRKIGDSKVVTTSAQGVLEEYLKTHQNLSAKIEGRLIFKKS
jgi:5'-nucleotidase/UDP-sugar diphosphatase